MQAVWQIALFHRRRSSGSAWRVQEHASALHGTISENTSRAVNSEDATPAPQHDAAAQFDRRRDDECKDDRSSCIEGDEQRQPAASRERKEVARRA